MGYYGGNYLGSSHHHMGGAGLHHGEEFGPSVNSHFNNNLYGYHKHQSQSTSIKGMSTRNADV